MKNRRAYPRSRQSSKITVCILDAPHAPDLVGRRYFSSTTDVSVAGLQFQARRSIPIDTRLNLQVEFVRPIESFKIPGRVVWNREDKPGKRYAVGIFFSDAPKEILAAWRRLLAERNLGA